MDELEKHGFSKAPGGVRLSGAALALAIRIEQLIREIAMKHDSVEIRVSPIVNIQTLTCAEYTNHFPHQLMPFDSTHTHITDLTLAPAACFHVYPLLTETRKPHFVVAQCARYENGVWNHPFRLPFFRMAEIVFIGTPDAVSGLRNSLMRECCELFDRLRLHGAFHTATDAFFLSEHAGAQTLQRMKELKKEYVVDVNEEKVAIASVNYHEEYFTKRFDIIGDTPLHTLCVAFGIERIIASCLLTWKDHWPEEFQ